MDISLEIYPPVALMGVPFDNVELAQALALLDDMVRSGRPHHVVTANVHALVHARLDAHLRRILCEADRVFCDGKPLVWISALLGNRLRERLAGADLVRPLFALAQERDYGVYWLGGQPAVALKAVENVRQWYPSLRIAGHYSPPKTSLQLLDNAFIIKKIREARPDILLVSLGSPKSEKWIASHYRDLDVPLVMGVGASIDFLAGRFQRAPLWMQNAGLEWFFRVLLEPRRLARRYGRDLRDLGAPVLAQWWQLGACAGQGSHAAEAHARAGHQVIVAGPRFDFEALVGCWAQWDAEASGRGHCLMDLSRVRVIDSTGIAALFCLRRRVRESGHELVLLGSSDVVQNALKTLRLDGFLPEESGQFEALQSIARGALSHSLAT